MENYTIERINNTSINDNTGEEIEERGSKGTITSLELLKQINFFRKIEGDRAELQHKDLLKIIRDEFEEEINERKISPVTYQDKKGEARPMYILTYEQGKQVLMRESRFVRRAVIGYIKALEQKQEQRQELTEKERLILNLHSSDPLTVKESYDRLVELETKPLKEEIEHKTTVITGLTKDIPTKSKRQIINQVVTHKGIGATPDRWHILYYEFEKAYRVNLKLRIRNYHKKHNKKISRLDLIEKELKKINELYQIACKLFESDIKEIINQYENLQ